MECIRLSPPPQTRLPHSTVYELDAHLSFFAVFRFFFFFRFKYILVLLPSTPPGLDSSCSIAARLFSSCPYSTAATLTPCVTSPQTTTSTSNARTLACISSVLLWMERVRHHVPQDHMSGTSFSRAHVLCATVDLNQASRGPVLFCWVQLSLHLVDQCLPSRVGRWGLLTASATRGRDEKKKSPIQAAGGLSAAAFLRSS